MCRLNNSHLKGKVSYRIWAGHTGIKFCDPAALVARANDKSFTIQGPLADLIITLRR